MNYREVINSKGIFQLIQEKNKLNFDVTDLDSLFIVKYGNLEFTKNVELLFVTSENVDEALNILANLILLEYSEVWNKLYATLHSKDLGLAKKAIKFISENKSNTNTHAISAYDSDTLINDNSDSTVLENEYNETNQEYDYSKIDKELQNYHLNDRIMLDVRNSLFLKII